jgi:hypothetical protein
MYFYFLEIFSRFSKENYKKYLVVAIAAESICFEDNDLSLVLKKNGNMHSFYAYGTVIFNRTFCENTNMVATSHMLVLGNVVPRTVNFCFYFISINLNLSVRHVCVVVALFHSIEIEINVVKLSFSTDNLVYLTYLK